ncbi:MAG TPA: ribonuclease H-like domain-containing protein [Polyangiaceae bacterium]|nr:ribonuclease H-like domain-containing protein [Polyangiaceae bacterium]
MSLKGRLSRLGPGPPLAAEERRAPGAPGTPDGSLAPHDATSEPEGSDGALAAPVPAGPAGPPPVVPHEVALDELRERMARILGRSAPVRTERPPVDWGELPFERLETDSGPVHLRTMRCPITHRVGRVEVEPARAASPELLALLALDPALRDVDVRRVLFLDTETTGLGGAGTCAFLVGLAWFEDEGRLCLEQLMLGSPAEEIALLEFVRARVERAALIVSFNGKSFDWPLLEGRLVMNGLPPLPRRPHFDLLHVARRLHKARLGGVRLIRLESEVLGFDRGEDDIPGAEIAPLYGHFLRTGRAELLRAVMDHNAWDVISMAALLGLYGEPLALQHPRDLLGAAETARRAGEFERAREYADASHERGGGAEAQLARARIEKARGDRARALVEFELLSREVDDPAVRLELCKLYEHHEHAFRSALELLEQGLAEEPEQVEKRRARLQAKERKRSLIPGGRRRR